MSNHINHSEYDAIGELFRRRLENHRTPVGDNDWDEIERRMGKRKKNKATLWLWSAGAMAAAAAIAALVIFNGLSTDENTITTVSQQVTPEEPATANLGTASSAPVSEKINISQVNVPKPTDKPVSNNSFAALPNTVKVSSEARVANLPKASDPGDTVSDTIDQNGQLVATAKTGQEQPGDEESVVAQAEKEIPKLDVSLVEDRPEEETDTKEGKKWLLAAAFGTGGYSDGLSNQNSSYDNSPQSSPVFGWDGLGSGNKYAAELSSSIKSFNNMARKDFKNINHSLPLSFGITARKSLGKHGGIESGLVYTYMSSQFDWEGYDVHQSLHYMGIPVNMVVYLWQTKPNWRIYLSGGFMVEKGLRAIYKQERWSGSEIRTTTVRSSIDGLQWSLNGAIGVNYRFNKGFGIYFEPRIGYAFDCDQPISMRTEWPIFTGVNMGLNYEF